MVSIRPEDYCCSLSDVLAVARVMKQAKKAFNVVICMFKVALLCYRLLALVMPAYEPVDKPSINLKILVGC